MDDKSFIILNNTCRPAHRLYRALTASTNKTGHTLRCLRGSNWGKNVHKSLPAAHKCSLLTVC